MSINQISLSFVQGDDVTFPVTITAPGSPSTVNLTGSTITGSIRKEYTSPVVGSFTIVGTNLAAGQFSLVLPKTVTSVLPINATSKITSYVFDVQITYPSGSVETVITGYLKMQHQVTV